MTYTINVTEWIPPNRDRADHEIPVRDDIAAQAKELVDAGYIFEFEVLRRVNSGSATLGDPKLELDRVFCIQSIEQSEQCMEKYGIDTPLYAIFHQLIIDAHAQWVAGGRKNAGTEWEQAEQEEQVNG